MSWDSWHWFIQYDVCRLVFPKALHGEVRRYLSESNLVNPTIFSRTDVSRAETQVGFTKKGCSTTAYQAFTLENIRICELFWSQLPPVGILGVEPNDLVDIYEAGITISKANPGSGKAYKNVRVRSPGNYSRSEKFTLIVAVGYVNNFN